MKRKTIGMMVSLFLSTGMVLAASAADASQPFTFRNGVTFGMTKEEVLATEGNPEIDDDEAGEEEMNGRMIGFLEIEDVDFEGMEADAEYAFVDDSMTFCGYELDLETDEEYQKVVDALSAQFGPAQEGDAERLNRLMEILTGQTGYYETLIRDGKSNSWATDTLFIILYDTDGDQELAYFDEPGILAMGAETSESETTGA